MKNTKQQGQVSFLIVKNLKTSKYLGICYELAIVLESDDEKELQKDLLDAVHGYVEVVQKESLPDEMFYRSEMLPAEYKLLYEEARSRIADKNKPIKKLSDEYEKSISTGNAHLSMMALA